MRKLMLIEQGMTETDNAKLVEKLESLEVDVRLSPCTLLSAANEGIPPDGHASSTGNACVMEGSATTDKMDKPSVVQGPPILTPDQLKDVQSPGALLLQVTYDNFNFEQVLKEILPGHVVPVTGFTTMGHIAHFNLRPDALPYRHVIGRFICFVSKRCASLSFLRHTYQSLGFVISIVSSNYDDSFATIKLSKLEM